VGHADSRLPAEVTARFWHGDCFANAMTDDRYLALLLWTICVLTFACSVVALTEHPEWFGA
jgi:hypothetical protein